ncbi:MAG: DUF3467 domain-containing protein [Patescibacteria group bacterium]
MEEKSSPNILENNNKIQIKAKDEILHGNYANALQIQYSQEEFILDFLTMFSPMANLNNRIITCPMHYKKMIKAMEESLKKYENKFGVIKNSGNDVETINGFPIK